MEGFTLVLLIAWLLLLGSFAAMFYMDGATKKAKSTPPPLKGSGK